jgi:hypothetical protein
MSRQPTLDQIFEEDDPFKLLAVRPRAKAALSSEEERHVQVVADVNAFYEEHGRLPDGSATEHEEFKLGTLWRSLPSDPTQAMAEADRNKLLGYGNPATSSRSRDGRWQADRVCDWRREPSDDEVPESLDEIFEEDQEDLPDAVLDIRNVTPAGQREKPVHRADLYRCPDFDTFAPSFEEMQAHLDEGRRVARPVEDGEEITLVDGSFFVHRGLLAYVAEKTELTRRGGKPDFRLRIVFSNGMELDPLMSSFRKALASDRAARVIERPEFGPLSAEWGKDSLDVTGTVYVARSKSEAPEIAEVRNILHKIGVTSHEVKRRIADARNDPTFLLADVEIVATYELRNLSRVKVEQLLHRFFDAARPGNLQIVDRFGKSVRPREWFYVLPEHVAEAVRLIREGTLHRYVYDAKSQKIIEEPARR